MEAVNNGKDRRKHRDRLRLWAVLFSFCALASALAGCASSIRPIGSTSMKPLVEAMPAMAPPPAQKTSAGELAAAIRPQPANADSKEEYGRIVDNPFLKTIDNPVSTFSIDVDTASYANLRRFLMESRSMPPKDAVRIEEMVNYFTYGYPASMGEGPVASTFMMSHAPWEPGHWLLRVALKAKEIDTAGLPASNLVFLVDISGSMSEDNKLPLLKESLRIMAGSLRPQDRLSIVTYSSAAEVALASTPGSKKEKIADAIGQLEAGGSTAGGAGIQLAYKVARENFIKGGNNRVILCTDGDFNIGVTSTSELERMIEEKRRDDIYLTVLGFRMGTTKTQGWKPSRQGEWKLRLYRQSPRGEKSARKRDLGSPTLWPRM